MRFLPYHELQDVPNIIVDGGGLPSTRLVLSHWPLSGTPRELKADLSAQIVFNYLERPEFHVKVPAVSNNHFDEDGLISLYSILNPEEALKQKDLLVDIASAGDFGTYRERQAVRSYFVISSFADADMSPLDKKIFSRPYPETAAALYEHVLERLPDILQNLESYESLWRAQDEFLTQSELALAEGKIRIEEFPDVDLAIVKAEDGMEIHPVAVHNATGCFRIAMLIGREYSFAYRYETWVQYISRTPLPRVDLHPLAMALSEEEGSEWKFDGVDAITPGLRKSDGGESRIPPQVFLERLLSSLRQGEPAWNPYD